MAMMLSKTDYISGITCEKVLWLAKHHPELKPEVDEMLQRRFDIGNETQELARKLFPTGKMVGGGEIEYAAFRTNDIAKDNDVLFEATAIIPDKAFCRIDVMERDGKAWNLIEIKSAAGVKEDYINDLAFQRYVFENAGYKINHCEVIYINSQYTRHGDLDIHKLFKREDVTLKVGEIYPEVADRLTMLTQIVEKDKEPEVLQHKTEPCKECEFKAYCRKALPEYPAFYLFHQDRSWIKFYEEYQTYNVEDVPQNYKLGAKALLDREAYLSQEPHVEPKQIKAWLDKLVYPLYYLDYELSPIAIPLFDNSHPYTQIPFQFSLHIQEKPGGELKHISFLHKERSDPRRAIAECLVNNLGTKGSVVVYHQDFEQSRNRELAALFPDLETQILDINKRVVDLEDVFKARHLYSPKQKSSSSIKYVLPAFSKLTYQGMEIANGGEAMSAFEAFLKGKQTPEETASMFAALEKYCEQDTYAMVVLMDVLYRYAER